MPDTLSHFCNSGRGCSSSPLWGNAILVGRETDVKAAAFVVSVVLLASSPAGAADKKDKEQAAVFQALLACREVSSTLDRLACYDSKIVTLATAEQHGDILIADRAQIREARNQVFGFGGVRIPFLSGSDSDMPSEVTATLTGLRDLGFGKWEFTLDNGMRWRQTDDDMVYPKVGQSVTVRTAAMGSYMLKVKSRAVRVIRTR